MLGRLLSTAASTLNPAAYSSKNAHQLESVTEEEHTSGLLFPDASLLRRSNTHAYPLHTTLNSPNASIAGAYDDRGGVELDPLKDFRVIVAQNALGDRDACVLLDTRATSPEAASQGLGLESQVLDNSGARHARTVSNLTRGARRGQLPQSSAVDPSPLSVAAEARRSPPISSGAFVRARGRSSTLSPAGGLHDPGNSRHSADANDSGLLNCIFGSSAFSYRGPSTKMHVISGDEEPGRNSNATPASRSNISRAYTTGSPSGYANPTTPGTDAKPPSKVTILLTRMFSVNLPETGDSSPERQDLATSIYQESLPEAGFPFPDLSKRKKIKEKKTPMYAVAITIQIPLLGRNAGRPVSRFSTQGSDSPRPGMACSLDSDYRWRGGFLDDSFSMASAPASLDERIDLLVDHWDVINRTLSHLERLARKEILFLLKKVDSSSGIHPKPAKAPNMQRTNQTIIHLPANILAVNSRLKEDAIRSTRRISLALQTPYVVTGQSRWGVWREEGRSIVRSLGDKEHSFFFLVLITAFLGNHTEWLNSLGPDWYRRRHYLQQKAQQQDADPILPNRTVIISPDKMTARRLIFLLSAFLPPKQRFEPLPSPIRPGTSASTRAVSQSPPTVPVLRQETLRRAMERRSRVQHLTVADRDQHQRSVSVSSTETAHRSTDDTDPINTMDIGTHRRGSDARSVRTVGVPMNARDVRHNKNTSTATTSTATPSTTVPVAHFASQSRSEREASDQAMADRNDSLASENLMKNLKRSESSAISTNNSVPSSGGRWGNLFSGLWSSRQDGSIDDGNSGPQAEARKRSLSVYAVPPKRCPPTLSQMVKEASGPAPEAKPPKAATSGNISIPNSSNAQHIEEDTQGFPRMDHHRESSLKLSVRGDDGVVDVDLPLPGFVSLSSSGDSTMASPKKTRTSVTSVDAMASTHSSGSGFHAPPRETEGSSINVAGWLKSFHEDFLLQAVRPYASLEADVKRAMRAEPTPPSAYSDADGSERWVDVATTLIADVRTFSVKRLRLRRKAAGNAAWRTPSSPPAPSYPGTPRHFHAGSSSASQIANFFSPATGSSRSSAHSPIVDGFESGEVEERFVEEPVMDLDGTLIDALERVLAQSGPSSLQHSRAPSPSRARRGDDKTVPEPAARDEPPSLEVPRTECRKLVLGALEEVVRSVTAEHCREDVDGELGIADRERKRSLAGPDNTLREGVRKWLLDVEEAW